MRTTIFALCLLPILLLSGCSDEDYYCDGPDVPRERASCYLCDGVGCRAIDAPARAACSCDYECANGTNCTALGCTTVCTDDAGCARGSQCRDGLCLHPREVAPADLVCECRNNAECGRADLACVNGICQPTVTPACSDTAPCAGGLVCVSGECRVSTDVCRFNTECGAQRLCVDQLCAPACAAGCPTGTSCNSSTGACEPIPSAACVANTDCAGANQVCINSVCYNSCTDDVSCGAGFYCDRNVCRIDDRPRPGCRNNTDCAAGSVCRNGACRSPCSTAEECARFDVQLTFCIDNLCATTNEATSDCGGPTECELTQSCIDGICR